MSPRIKIRKHTIFLVNNRLRDQSLPHVVTVSILAATTTTKSFRFILCFVHASSGFSHCPKASSTSHGRRVLYSLGCVCAGCACCHWNVTTWAQWARLGKLGVCPSMHLWNDVCFRFGLPCFSLVLLSSLNRVWSCSWGWSEIPNLLPQLPQCQVL